MAKKAVTPAPKQDQKGLEEALSKSEQFFENNKKTIFGILIAIIVIIAGGMCRICELRRHAMDSGACGPSHVTV